MTISTIHPAERKVRKSTTAQGGVSPSPTELLSGAEILIRSLEAEGVEIVFGHPGGAVIKIYDEIDRLKPSFEHILVRHEQGGTHAAEGYAKATGKVGTVLVTSGPGATNCVTGIADAYLDSIPLVVFTGQVPTHLIGNDAFQETDTIGITRSITKHNFLVRDVAQLSTTIKSAYHIARTGRPGPVVVDLPKDVMAATTQFHYPSDVTIRGYVSSRKPDTQSIRRAASMIGRSSRPVLYVGGGTIASGASDKLTHLARKTQIPVTTTLHGLGAFPEDDPLSLGMLGMHGTWYANQSIQNADLIVAVGARFDDRVTGKLEAWAPHAEIVHIDIDPACISKNIQVDCPIVGDVGQVLDELIPLVDAKNTDEWHAQIAYWKTECPMTFEPDELLRPQYILERLRAYTDGDAFVVSDVGQNQMWAAQYFNYNRPRSHITSGGLGTMGFSLPAAIGVAFSQRKTNRPVISVNGDGGFLMNSQELGVAAAHQLPIKVIILNNGHLGMVRQWQELFHEERYSHTNLVPTNPDFVKLAEAYHCAGMRVTSPKDVDEAIRYAFSVTDRPTILDCHVVKEEMVFPMVPAGAASHEMITARFRD